MKFFSLQTRSTSTYSNPNQWTMNMRGKLPVVIPVVQPIVPTPPPPPSNVGKVKWGPAVWFFLHTVSVKIKDEAFQSLRTELLSHIYAICCNLPCPECSNHAKAYLDGINFNTIQTKYDLKKMLWAFHNSVNQRKGYTFFPFEQVDETFLKAITNNIFINFIAHFSDRNRSLKLLPTDLHRSRLCNTLKLWLNSNINAFYP
jgi:hypothetical protein